MKTLYTLLITLAALCCLSFSGSMAALADERILDFDSTIHIQADNSLQITERITVLSLGKNIIHGIVREIPGSYVDDYDYTVSIKVSVREALLDGEPTAVRQVREDGLIRLIIGQEEQKLAPGEHVFELEISVFRQLRYAEGYDALYWLATGPDWGLPIDSARAMVHLPEEGIPYQDSFADLGKPGDFTRDVAIEELRPGVMQFTATRPLAPGEGLYIALAWPKGLVKEPTANEYFRPEE